MNDKRKKKFGLVESLFWITLFVAFVCLVGKIFWVLVMAPEFGAVECILSLMVLQIIIRVALKESRGRDGSKTSQ